MSAFLIWFDENPARHWWFACLVVTVAFYLALRPLLRSEIEEKRRDTDWIWGVVILLVLLVGRWPSFFIATDLSADESQMLAGAITLRHDPIFWRSVDGNTAGPLDFYALLPVGWMLGQNSYLSARITALLLIATTLFFLHNTVVRFSGRTAARIGGLSTLCFEAFTTHSDLLHYSTELVPLALLSVALYLSVREGLTKKPDLISRFVLGLLLGAVPFAKLQGMLIAALIAGSLFFVDASKSPLKARNWVRGWIAMISGALVPCTFFVVMVVGWGEWQNAITSYLKSNLGYVTTNESTWLDTLMGLSKSVSHPGDLVRYWLVGGIAMLFGAIYAAQHWTGRKRWSFTLTSICMTICVVSVLVPSRSFAHYLQFLIFPGALFGGLCAGVVIETVREQHPLPMRALLTLILFWPPLTVMADRLAEPHPIVGHMALSYNRSPSPAVQMISQVSAPTDSLAVWGWMSSYHVETGLRQALRESHSVEQIHTWPLQAFYRHRYLQDMLKQRPAVFADAVGPGNFGFRDRKTQAHDAVFPELAALVRAHYTLIGDLSGSRIYLRNDLLAKNGFAPPHRDEVPWAAQLF